jgi:heme exporter protein B
MKNIVPLIQKEFLLEWRQKYALNGMVLYVISTIFICYMSFKLKVNSIEPITWNTLFWIILLFAAVNSITKSFTQERDGRHLYYYTISDPESIILSKIIYNILLMLFLGILGFGIYALMMGNPVQSLGLFSISILLGSIGFACSLTLIAGIASKAENTASLMAVLSFPTILPMLLMLMRLSKNAMDGLGFNTCIDEIVTLCGIDIIVIVLSYILFPYLWKS